MNFSIDKILAAFGNIRAMERTHVDHYTEDIINSIDEKPFALSEQNVMYAKAHELGGFYYFKTIIVGSFKIKTIKGARLKVIGTGHDIEFKSDMDEFESEYSNVSNRFITRIDFQIEKEDAKLLTTEKLNTLTLVTKKKHLVFKTVRS